ncbi:unnamed protein product, partial [Prorocentrum cordatum]
TASYATMWLGREGTQQWSSLAPAAPPATRLGAAAAASAAPPAAPRAPAAAPVQRAADVQADATSKRSSLAPAAQGGRVVDELPLELQEKLMNIQEDIDSEDGLEVLIRYLRQCRGDRDDDKQKEAFRPRSTDWLEKIQVEQLKSGAHLSEQNLINMLSISQGRDDLDSIKKAMMRMDAKRIATKASAGGAGGARSRVFASVENAVAAVQEQAGDDEEDMEEWVVEFLEDSVLEHDDAEAVHVAVDHRDLDEDQLRAVIGAILDEMREEEGKPRRWAESKELKRAMARVGSGKQRLSIEKLKARSKCANCGQKGHWRKECPNPFRPKPRSKAETRPRGPMYVRGGDGASSGMTWLAGAVRIEEICRAAAQVADGVRQLDDDREPAGMVDTAAGQALAGSERLEKLKAAYARRGWKIPTRHGKVAGQARGVGGSAKVIGEALIPITATPNQSVIILFRIVEGPIPPLLPVKWPESVGAVVDLRKDVIDLSGTELPSHREPPGHRLVSLLGARPPLLFEVAADAAVDWPGLKAADICAYSYLLPRSSPCFLEIGSSQDACRSGGSGLQEIRGEKVSGGSDQVPGPDMEEAPSGLPVRWHVEESMRSGGHLQDEEGKGTGVYQQEEERKEEREANKEEGGGAAPGDLPEGVHDFGDTVKPEVDRTSVAIELETKLEAARGPSLPDVTTEARGPTSSPPDRDVRKTLQSKSGSPAKLIKEARAMQRRRQQAQQETKAKDEWETIGMDEGSEATDPEPDQEELSTGKIIFPPTMQTWRRMTLRAIWSSNAKATIMNANIMSGERAPEAALECDHPRWARRRGTNQYAKYEHCLKCKTRLWIERDRHSDHTRPSAQAEPPPLAIKPEPVYKKTVTAPATKVKTEKGAQSSGPETTAKVLKALDDNNNKALQQMAEAVQGNAIELDQITTDRQWPPSLLSDSEKTQLLAQAAVFLVTGEEGREFQESLRGYTRARVTDEGIPLLESLTPDLSPAQLQNAIRSSSKDVLKSEAWRSEDVARFSGLLTRGAFQLCQ